MHTACGPIVATTQIYDVYEEPGYDLGKQSSARALLADGYELVNVGQTALRAVTGGTGPYRGVQGQMEQMLLGVKASGGGSCGSPSTSSDGGQRRRRPRERIAAEWNPP